MAIYDKTVFHIAALQANLVRIRNVARQREHKDALDALLEDSVAMLDHARQLFLDQQAGNECIEPPLAARNSWGFDQLSVGEYIAASIAASKTLRASASAYGKRNGARFSVKNQSDGTVRCYRIA